MILSTLFLSFAPLFSCVFASVSEFMADESLKAAAIRGLDYMKGRTLFQQSALRYDHQKGIEDLKKESNHYAKFIQTLTPEELNTEINVQLDYCERKLAVYEEVKLLIQNGSLQPNELERLLFSDSINTIYQAAASEILDIISGIVDNFILSLQANVENFGTLFTMLQILIKAAPLGLLLEKSPIFAESSPIPISEHTLKRLVASDPIAAANFLVNNVLVDKEQLYALKEASEASRLSYDQLSLILDFAQFFTIKELEREDITGTCKNWRELIAKPGKFNENIRPILMKQASLMKSELDGIIEGILRTDRDNMASHLESIRFAEILALNHPAPLREAEILKYTNLTRKKAQYCREVLLNFLNLHWNAAKDTLDSKCTISNILRILTFSKMMETNLLEGLSIDDIYESPEN